MGTGGSPDGVSAMESILREERWGCLGLSMEGQPYVVPLNYAYVDGKILFHCALKGRKLDAIRANPNVCFVVARQMGPVRDHTVSKTCHVDCDSVICSGTARIVEDLGEHADVLNAFNRAFYADAGDLATNSVRGCAAVEIAITEMTGRTERDGKRTLWRRP